MPVASEAAASRCLWRISLSLCSRCCCRSSDGRPRREGAGSSRIAAATATAAAAGRVVAVEEYGSGPAAPSAVAAMAAAQLPNPGDAREAEGLNPESGQVSTQMCATDANADVPWCGLFGQRERCWSWPFVEGSVNTAGGGSNCGGAATAAPVACCCCCRSCCRKACAGLAATVAAAAEALPVAAAVLGDELRAPDPRRAPPLLPAVPLLRELLLPSPLMRGAAAGTAAAAGAEEEAWWPLRRLLGPAVPVATPLLLPPLVGRLALPVARADASLPWPGCPGLTAAAAAAAAAAATMELLAGDLSEPLAFLPEASEGAGAGTPGPTPLADEEGTGRGP